MAHRAHSKITLFHGGSHLTLVSHPAAVTSVIASGIVPGGPIVIWDSVRKAKRIEHESRGTLWSTTGFAWTSRGRCRYSVVNV
jgi:hypothetical protein